MADALAIYGATIGSLAAVGALWNIYNTGIRDRARLRLSISMGTMQDPPHVRADEWVWFVEAANDGRRPLTISSAGGLEFPNGRYSAFTGGLKLLPKRLEEGDKVMMWCKETALKEAIDKHGILPTHIRFSDDVGRTHRKRIPAQYRQPLGRLLER